MQEPVMATTLGGRRPKSAKTEHVMRTYPVAATTTGGVTNKIFTGNSSTSMVCKLIQKETGALTPDPGCADAAAFTVWHDPHMGADAVYLPDGRKDPAAPWAAVKAEVHTTLPTHVGPAPPGLHGEDVARFLARLAMHERGHGATGEQLVASALAFLEELPPSIPRAEVRATNKAVSDTLKTMLRLARWADHVFDEVTIHGTTSGSIANDTPKPRTPAGLGL